MEEKAVRTHRGREAEVLLFFFLNSTQSAIYRVSQADVIKK